MGQKEKPHSAGRREPVRIVIADDHPLFRVALRQMLDRHSELEVVGEAKDGEDAIELCRRLEPDLVLMDIRMPRMDGLESTRRIKRQFPKTIILVLTGMVEPDYLSEALKAGVSGYVLKYASAQEISDAVRRVVEGESPLNQELDRCTE
jgi:two-component system, NarL family, response regulator LiaR